MTPTAWYVLAESASNTYFRFARLQAMSEWWHWLAIVALAAAVVAYVIAMYWIDSVELRRGVAWTLIVLRIAAFGGILFFFLDLEKRTEDRDIKHSRVLMLVDTSQSMGLRDTDVSRPSGGPSRMDQVVAELRRGELFKAMRARHDVAVYAFDQKTQPRELAFFERSDTSTSAPGGIARAVAQKEQALHISRLTAATAGALGALALLSLILYLMLGRIRRGREATSWSLLVSIVLLIAAMVVFAVAHLQSPSPSIRALLGLAQPDLAAEVREELAASQLTTHPEDQQPAKQRPDQIAWQQQLIPQGTETRIGDTVRTLVRDQRGGPVTGIVLLTDGGNNAGVDCDIAANVAQTAGIPIYAVGLGSDLQPVNVRVVDLEAPKRVYPGDKFTVTGYLQAYGLAGRLVKVELGSKGLGTPGPDGKKTPDQEEVFEDERSVRLPEDGEVLTIKFEVTPEETGPRLYQLKVAAPEQDIEPNDNQQTARVKVVERKTHVLIIAGGPTREYRFLRNLLFRDQDVTLDVWLQSGTPGISQDADDVLFEFPQLADELFQYDCIIAFDPDWTLLDEDQVNLLDRWVAEQAGGLITVAGPVFTPEWTGIRRGRDTRMDTIRALYPVVFYSQGSPNMSLGRFGGDSAWPLDFTRDGLSAEFLWLEDDPTDSEADWQTFDGVFGYYAVKDPKPGARVYARFSNPDTSIDGELPIYMAGQFYGAGRVFFQASGEMWRLRAVEERFFESYYTKLIRWVSQGRLMRDSSLGILLVDKDRCLLGDRITVRAVLNDAQHQPLTAEQVPAILIRPDGTRSGLLLRKVQDASREGMYQAQFTAMQEGDYRVELTPPQSASDELLTAEVRVRMPALEMEHPERDDALLKHLADVTGGKYYIGLDAAMGRGTTTRAALPATIEPNDKIVYLPESVDTNFEKQLMGWLIVLIATMLCLEWLIRRLSKLA